MGKGGATLETSLTAMFLSEQEKNEQIVKNKL